MKRLDSTGGNEDRRRLLLCFLRCLLFTFKKGLEGNLSFESKSACPAEEGSFVFNAKGGVSF